MNKRNPTNLILAIALLIAFASCATPVVDLRDDPSRYAGEEAKISGTITDIRPIPLTEYVLYTVQDEAAQAFVLTSVYDSDRKLYQEASFSGEVQYAGTGDPVARSALQRSITENLASSSHPVLRFRAVQIGAVVAPLLDEAAHSSGLPPVVVILEEK